MPSGRGLPRATPPPVSGATRGRSTRLGAGGARLGLRFAAGTSTLQSSGLGPREPRGEGPRKGPPLGAPRRELLAKPSSARWPVKPRLGERDRLGEGRVATIILEPRRRLATTVNVRWAIR